MSPPNLDNQYGFSTDIKTVALIREDECIGCTKCIQACPVDAILGAAKQMHTVIEKECTGCDLCIDPCPVDCIDMVETKSYEEILQKDSAQFNDALSQRQILERSIRDNSRERYQFHQARLERDKRERDELLKSRTIALKEKMLKDKAQKQTIEAAIRRVKDSKKNNETN